MTPLGLLNFLVLQWFGVRLARCYSRERVFIRRLDGSVFIDREDLVPVGWKVLRWIVPLTGWWSDFRYIAKRPKPRHIAYVKSIEPGRITLERAPDE